MDFRQCLIADNLDVLYERIVDAFSHVELLEEIVVLFALVVELVNHVFIKHFFLYVHETLYVFETDVILKCPS